VAVEQETSLKYPQYSTYDLRQFDTKESCPTRLTEETLTAAPQKKEFQTQTRNLWGIAKQTGSSWGIRKTPSTVLPLPPSFHADA
jgi:hypothetical protein